MNLDLPENAPERWLAQECILREAAVFARQMVYGKAAKLVALARELGPLTDEQEERAKQIERGPSAAVARVIARRNAA